MTSRTVRPTVRAPFWWALVLIGVAMVAAIAVRRAAPPAFVSEVRVLGFAAPGEAVAGQRVTTFGALDRGTTSPVWHRLEVCGPGSASCLTAATARLDATERPVWVGTAGHLSFPEPGRFLVRWSVYADAGVDTPLRTDVREATVNVLEATDARR